ncbi:hypothetical protein GCQ56_14760 [Marinifilum sp. N1E240]|uniref:hypothetical protein n=1 Tax=Marinifilum sp. N1E240 TaxID=2608082 RepID=UPI00128D2730|nr:hypothetical protein [Marinifilum sp. N1E240]MPQ48262.1 hypothetical protein [Marinifilum sp. N1E240]
MKTYTLILFALVIYSCSSPNEDSRIRILNYSVGDSLVNNYDTIKEMDKPSIYARDTRDPRIEFSLIDKYISKIRYKNLTNKEIEDFTIEITEKLKQKPKYQKDIKASGVIFYGEDYKWIDSISKDHISIFIPMKNGKKLKGTLSIYNEKIYKNLIRKFDPEYYADSIRMQELNKNRSLTKPQ